jgi:hypothetical protein
MNAVKTSGGLRERLFNSAYNAKKQAILSGTVYHQFDLSFCSTRFILVFRLSRIFFFFLFGRKIGIHLSKDMFSSFFPFHLYYICIVFGIPPI